MSADRPTFDSWTGRIDPEPDTLRWHQVIRPIEDADRPGVALIGFACDEGVRRNQGRPGAAHAPAAIRKALANVAWHREGPAFDAGDIVCTEGGLEAAQARLSENVTELLAAGHFPIVMGGGHEVAYGSWEGLAGHLARKAGRTPRIGIVNFDAHFDLRDPAPVTSSGTPFTQIAEACAIRGWPFRYACIGVSRASNTRALFRRAADLDVLVREDREVTPASLADIGKALDAFIAGCDHVHLTIDLDVLPAWEAPGVSAPAAHGVPLALLEPLVERVRDSGKVRLAELAELNPEFDLDHRTARVAARLIHTLTLNG
ncbi:formimidoylglutamase [Azoarcus sp. KH32C]|uniref:formimidoylglutamase n=1 Tax=Azoarcus sp. KH32C TaxID=748247 RepID=UPI0002385F06|nr:formimidoylglutamase [Azoarcus sp. KH32C]BAL25582.1 formimidoylglutamase [Azoarcus sp. KH32C]